MKRTYWESWSWAVAGCRVMLISQGSHLEKGQVGVRRAARSRAGDGERGTYLPRPRATCSSSR